jgi:hypothetical protein
MKKGGTGLRAAEAAAAVVLDNCNGGPKYFDTVSPAM